MNMLKFCLQINLFSDDDLELSHYKCVLIKFSGQARLMAYSTPFSQPSGSAGMYSSMYLKGSGMAR